MGVLGKSRQGCVGVINNIGALTNLLTSKAILVLPNTSAYVYSLFVNVNGHLGMFCAVDTIFNYCPPKLFIHYSLLISQCLQMVLHRWASMLLH